jgi:hypothetical protein
MHYIRSRQAVSFFILFTVLFSSVSTFGQKRRAAAPAKPASQTSASADTKSGSKKCNGGWSGTITYSKSYNQNEHNKTPTGYQNSTSSFSATAEVTIREDGSAQSSVKVKISGKTEDVKEGSECCSISLAGCTKKGNFKLSDVIETKTEASATSTIKGLSVGEETFSANISLPEAEGETVRTFNSVRIKECDSVNQNNSHTQKATASYSVGPIQFTAEIDPKNPNVISGSQTDGDVTVSYSLTRCASKDIKLVDLALEHHEFPDPTAWHSIGSQTIDGNVVRIKAKVRNNGNSAGSASVIFTETAGNVAIPGGSAVSLQPGEEKEIVTEWDTTGFAWSKDKKPLSGRQVKAQMGSESLTEDVRVIPKPVILVHGLWSNAAAWQPYQSFLNEAHSFAWKAFPVGADPEHGLMNTGQFFGNNAPTNSIFQNARELGKQIKHVRETMNAWHVDVVAHSMGGLISRFYIHHMMPEVFDGKPEIIHLAMLGTPNMGSPWADIMFAEYLQKGWHVEALRELKTDVMRTFNSQVTNRKGVLFSITYTDKLPFTGGTKEPGDGVVSVSSATWEIVDRSKSSSLDHTSLTGRDDFINYIYPRLAVPPGATIR